MRKMKKKNLLLEVLSYMRLIIVCLIVAFLLKTLVLKPVHVKGDSMYPTLQDDDIGLSNVFSMLSGGIQRFDVVVVKDHTTGNLIVKRVIGLPNERVEYREGKLYIDDQYVEEPFLDEAYMKEATKEQPYFTADVAPVVLGDDEYFVVGDNRVNSLDSRATGPYKESEIVSKDVYVLYPFSRFHLVMNGS